MGAERTHLLDLVAALLGLGFALVLAHSPSGHIGTALVTAWALQRLDRFLAEHRIRRYVKKLTLTTTVERKYITARSNSQTHH